MITKEQFDEKYYLQKYKDVANSGMNGWEHYRRYGFKEGRYYSPEDELNHTFDAKFYLEAYPDVLDSGMEPLAHYKKYGRKEGRLPFVNWEHVNIIKNSTYFDSEWYVRYYFNVRNSKLDPAVDYLVNGRTGNRNPGPYFSSKEYLLISPDVAAHKMNPLVHYEKYGCKENRKVQLCDLNMVSFPEKTEMITCTFKTRVNKDNHIVSVFASYFGNGIIGENIIYLLQGLAKVSDYIIIVADNPVYREELSKINELVNSCIFIRHEEYDFGSYKRGYKWLVENDILEEGDSLLFLNDSCYGPVYGFEEVIEKYKSENCDFYGLSLAKFPVPYIQSFFYIFKENVYKSDIFKEFINDIKKEISAAHVIFNYEFKFTQVLVDAGFTFSTYVPSEAFLLDKNSMAIVPTKFTLTLLKKFRYPLVKVKVLQGSSLESVDEIINLVEDINPELGRIINSSIRLKKQSLVKRVGRICKYDLYDRYEEKIRERVLEGGKIRVVFLVNMSSMFPGENLMNLLIQDERFDVQLFVIPDIRFGNEEMLLSLSNAYIELRKKYNFTKIAVDVLNDRIYKYKDVVKFADIVCYPSPYDLSYSLYNPPYAAELGIPSIHINYGFFRSKYDREIYGMDNYNNFWKVFLETKINYDEYQKFGYCNASNAVITGYSKMDCMNQYLNERREGGRKKIILAPHHSVEGGTNKILSLSNFQKYSELFLKLPQDYPEIDFVFRPHPMLFTVLKRKTQWGEAKVEDYINKMTSFPNVVYSTNGNYIKEFAESDGIIQDCGSFLVEYMYTERPCCYMLKSPDDIEEKFSKLGKKCLENCYIAYEEKNIREFIENVIIKEIDYKKIQRSNFVHNQVMINYPYATQKVYEEIIKSIWKTENSTYSVSRKNKKNGKICEKDNCSSNENQKLIQHIYEENEKLARLYSEQYKEIERLKEEKEQFEKENRQFIKEKEKYICSIIEEKKILEQEKYQLLHSASWKLTEPLRWIYFRIIGKNFLINKQEKRLGSGTEYFK